MLIALLSLALDLHQTRIPVHFEPNHGQVGGETEWMARARGGTMYIKGSAIAFETREPSKKPRIMRFVNARPDKGQGVDPTGGYSNYFDGRDEKNWRTGIPHYDKVRYSSLYKGIDLVYYATKDGQIEYDLEAAPGADLNQVELAFEGFNKIALTAEGDLELDRIKQRRPKITQAGHQIQCTYKLSKANRVTLDIADYDEALPLTVDPVLEFATYFGGPGNDGFAGVALDSGGNIIVAGGSETPSNPTLDPFQQTNTVLVMAFVAKLTPNADKLLYYTTIRSGYYSYASGLVVDSSGSPILYGSTGSGDFPLKNPIDSMIATSFTTGFVTKFAPDGRSLVYSTYFGGSGLSDAPYGGVIDTDGSVVIVGYADGHDIPIKNAFQPHFGGGTSDCYVAKIDPKGGLVFSTYFGGSGTDYCDGIAIGPGGFIYLSGLSWSDDLPLKNPIQSTITPLAGYNTPFLARFSPDASKLDYATFLGGGSPGAITLIAFNSKGEIYLGGYGNSRPPFTTVNAFQDTCPQLGCAVVMKLDPTGQKILNSTYFDGSNFSAITSILIGSDDSVFIAGRTQSDDFPAVRSLFPYGPGGTYNAFLAKFLGDLRTLVFSTFLGPQSNVSSMTFDSAGRIYLAGATASTVYPVKNAFQKVYGGGPADALLLRLTDSTVAEVSPLTASPGQIQLRYIQGGPPLAPQNVQITDSGAPVSFAAKADAAWVTVLPQSGTTPVTLSIGAAVLTPGNYTATATLTPSSGAALNIPITLKILSPAPQLTSVEPSFIALGSDDTTITFHGAGFTAQTQILLGATVFGYPTVFVDPQTLTAKMNYLAFINEGSYQLSAVNPQSDVSGTVTLSVGRLTPVINSVLNVASQLPGPIAAGELLQVNGTNFGPPGQVTATVGGILASIISSTDSQALILVPAQPQSVTDAAIVLISGTLPSVPATLPLAPVAPALFTADNSGIGQALVGGAAAPGSSVTLFGTGIADLTQAITLSMNGEDSPVTGVSPVDGKPGWFQITIAIPSDLPTDSPVTVVLSVAGQASQPGVTLALTSPQ